MRARATSDAPSPNTPAPPQMSGYSETRFDSPQQMPLGVSLNYSSLAARALASVAFNPASLLLVLALGSGAVRTIRDASQYAGGCARDGAATLFRAI